METKLKPQDEIKLDVLCNELNAEPSDFNYYYDSTGKLIFETTYNRQVCSVYTKEEAEELYDYIKETLENNPNQAIFDKEEETAAEHIINKCLSGYEYAICNAFAELMDEKDCYRWLIKNNHDIDKTFIDDEITDIMTYALVNEYSDNISKLFIDFKNKCFEHGDFYFYDLCDYANVPAGVIDSMITKLANYFFKFRPDAYIGSWIYRVVYDGEIFYIRVI